MKYEHRKELGRTRAREILSQSESFKNLPIDKQRAMYEQVVSEQMEIVGNEDGDLSSDLVLRRLLGRRRGAQKASDLLNDQRHERGFEEGVDAFEDLVDSVEFPAFVRDLLDSVFQANIEVMEAQTQDYIKLMKQATTGLANFIKEIGDDNARAYAAENNPNEFDILVEDDGEGGEKIALTRPDGEKVDEDEEAQILADAKIRMAQEHRHALREMILMGVTRLVVDKGEIEAEVNFEFKGTREIDKSDKALLKKDTLTRDREGEEEDCEVYLAVGEVHPAGQGKKPNFQCLLRRVSPKMSFRPSCVDM